MPARGALTLFKIRGIRISLDYSWFLVLLLVIVWLSDFYRDVLGVEPSALEPYLLAVVSALLFFGSILLHELGHALVAVRHGIGISDITLWMFGGLARMERDTDSPGTEFKVAIAGPLVTLGIALACAGIGVLAGGDGFWEAMRFESDADSSGALAVLAWLGTINVLVLAFNLIPAFPLDGGRVARALAWWRTGDRNRATRFAAALGQGFSYLFIGIGVYLLLRGAVIDGIWLAVLGFLLGQSAKAAAMQTELSSRIEHLRVADVMERDPVAIPDDLSVDRALEEYFLRYRWAWFPVVDAAQRFLGMLRRDEADAVPDSRRASSRVAEVLGDDYGRALGVSEDTPLESLLGNDAIRRLGALAAIDENGRLRGVITIDQVSRALRTALTPEGPPAPPSGTA